MQKKNDDEEIGSLFQEEQDADVLVISNDFRRRHTNLKRLVRTLHLSRPAYHVMAILGKSYPDNELEFRKSRMLGFFDPEMAGKRMKLKTPTTWETQLSEQGNCAEVWERLISEKKLPYMATLRNLRNLVMAGVSDATVRKTANYLTNETAVRNGKQLPTQYISAITALDQLKELAEKKYTDFKPKDKEDPDQIRMKFMFEKLQKRQKNINKGSLQTFKAAVEKAMEISAKINIPPIKGDTLIFYGERTKPAGVFIAMLIKSAERVEVTNRPLASEKGNRFLNQSKDMNIQQLLELVDSETPSVRSVKMQERKLDNFVIVNASEDESEKYSSWVNKYRETTNPNLYAIHLSTNPPRLTGEVSVSRRHPNDVHLSGFSDQIFHSMASTCSGSQLERIECVDKRFNLHCSTSHFSSGGDEGLEEKLNVSWPRVRVFISSTFDDMHGERDLIHRYIFPELRRRCRGIRMDVVPVDLRSGH